MSRPTHFEVKAAKPEIPVPMERRLPIIVDGKRNNLIHSTKTVKVPNTRYYRRVIAKGDLIDVNAKKAKAPAKPKPAKGNGNGKKDQ